MGHKDLLVTRTLYRQRDYSEAHDAASAAPAASFESASVQRTLIGPERPTVENRPMHSSRINCAPKGRLVMKKTLVTIEDGF